MSVDMNRGLVTCTCKKQINFQTLILVYTYCLRNLCQYVGIYSYDMLMVAALLSWRLRGTIWRDLWDDRSAPPASQPPSRMVVCWERLDGIESERTFWYGQNSWTCFRTRICQWLFPTPASRRSIEIRIGHIQNCTSSSSMCSFRFFMSFSKRGSKSGLLTLISCSSYNSSLT